MDSYANQSNARYEYRNETFASTPSYQYNPFNINPSVTPIHPINSSDKKVADINKNLGEVKDMVHKNLDLIVERGSNLDDLERSSYNLSVDANIFKNRSRDLKRKMWWRNCKYAFLIFLLIAVIIAVIVGLYYATK